MPLGLGGSPWWTPGQAQQQPEDFGDTPWSRGIREQEPQSAWYRYGRQMGVPDDDSAFSKWFGNQYPNYRQGYAAWTQSNPFGNIDEYTNTLGGFDKWYEEFSRKAPQLRGLDPGSRGGGPTRWVSWA